VPIFIKHKSAHQHHVRISCTKLDNKCVTDGQKFIYTCKYSFHSVSFHENHINSLNFCGHLWTEIYPNWGGELKIWAQLFAPKYSKAFIADIFMKLTISQWHYVEIYTEFHSK